MTSESPFVWIPEYDALLEEIAATDIVNEEWPTLRDIIKHKIETNVELFLSTARRPLPPPSFPPVELALGGLKLPPFPPRKRNQIHFNELPLNDVNDVQVNDMKSQIFEQLDLFETGPPFTIQRLCELCTRPKQHYTILAKYLRAVEKSVLVTSSTDSFPPVTSAETDASSLGAVSQGPLLRSAPHTPLFSPIPFLHDDARRSDSRSPPLTPLTLGSGVGSPELSGRALGLVDELDDPSPTHMSDHPTPLSSVTTPSKRGGSKLFGGSLEDRFVRAEDAETKVPFNQNNMVLDDKEDSKSSSTT